MGRASAVPLIDRLGLDLAWKRVKEDIKDQHFVDYPYLAALIDANLGDWNNKLRTRVLNEYVPSRSVVIDIPKPGWHIRPGHILEMPDCVLYSSLLLDNIHLLRTKLDWSSNKFRYSSILRKDQLGIHWCELGIAPWKEFQESSIRLIDDGHDYVLFTDITAFFENIDIDRLIADLRDFGAFEDNLNLLSKCLYRWAEPRRRGIPQGHTPSSILADVYLNSIDQRLVDCGIKMKRYSDDMRIFCDTEREAVQNLHMLTGLFREKGLNIQSAKSRIVNGNEAKQEIHGEQAIIPILENALGLETKSVFQTFGPYTRPQEINRLMKITGIEPKLKTLRSAFDEYFLTSNHEFDKHLFHYLINRLGACQDQYAIEYCLDALLRRPEETDHILKYLSVFKENTLVVQRLSQLLENGEESLEYQEYVIIRWFYEEEVESDTILRLCRKILQRSQSCISWPYSISYLGKHGNSADIDAIESMYAQLKDDLLRSILVCSLKNLERSRRNAMFARAKDDGYLVGLAVNFIKSSKED